MSQMLYTRLLPLSHIPLKSLPQSLHRAHGRYSSTIRVAELLQDSMGVSSHRNILNGFRTFCSSKDLTIKKCVPCDSKELRPMTVEAANHLIKKVPEWELVNDGGVLKLHQSWNVKTFTKGMEFLKAVAAVAEAEGHHPDLHLVGWNNVKLDIWTHAVGGLTENDFILAAKIDMLDLKPLLSRKAV